jgi:hypothetical protein
LRGRLGGADIHGAVDLAAIGADNLSLVKPGQVESQPALADARGADNGNKVWICFKNYFSGFLRVIYFYYVQFLRLFVF